MNKRIQCRVIIDVDQEIELTEAELVVLEKHLEKTNRIEMHSPEWKILQYEIDLDFYDDKKFKNVELEDAE